MATKAIKDFELANGIIFTDLSDDDAKKQITEDEFKEMQNEAFTSGRGFTQFRPDDRIKFLRANGYEVTRANIADGDLSTVEKQ